MKYDYRELQQFFSPKRTAEQNAQLQADDLLRDEVEYYQDFSKVVNWSASMKEAHAELGTVKVQTARVRKIGLRRVLSLAASILILFSSGTFWYANSSYSNAGLADLNEGKLNLYDSNVLRSGDLPSESILNEAAIALEANNPSEAWDIMQVVSENDPASVQLLKAYIAYQLQDFEDAQRISKKVLVQESTKITAQKAEWLIVQSKLAQSVDDAEFRSLVQKIASDNIHLFQKEAIKLEKSLNSFWRRFLL